MPISSRKKQRRRVKVREHHKMQRCGPGGTERKRILIKTYKREQDVFDWFSKLSFEDRVVAFIGFHNPEMGEKEKLDLVRALAGDATSEDSTVKQAMEWLTKLAS